MPFRGLRRDREKGTLNLVCLHNPIFPSSPYITREVPYKASAIKPKPETPNP